MRKLRPQRGMSLVEVTIILLVLMLLTGVLAPSIFDMVIDAKMVKVKEDCEAIGVTVARLVRDVGTCLKFNGTLPCTIANRVDILYSDGPDVLPQDVNKATAPDFGQANIKSPINWDYDLQYGDSMENQFVLNAPIYGTPTTKGTFLWTVPVYGLGWRGAYMASPIGPDPWGRKYLVNSGFLGVAVDATPESEGYWGWDRDVFCISGGPNEHFETPFQGNGAPFYGTTRRGDEFIFIIQGSTR
jgi:type II secretory pathway pseudopilin PulG